MSMIIDGMSLGRGKTFPNKQESVSEQDLTAKGIEVNKIKGIQSTVISVPRHISLDMNITPITHIVKGLCSNVFNTVKIISKKYLDTVIANKDDPDYEIKIPYDSFIYPHLEMDMRMIIVVSHVRLNLSDQASFKMKCHIDIYDLNGKDVSFSDVFVYISNNESQLSYDEEYVFLRDEEFTWVDTIESYLEDAYNHPNIEYIYTLLGWSSVYLNRNTPKRKIEIVKDDHKLSLITLNSFYKSQVEILDNLSENKVADMLDCDDYAYGLLGQEGQLLGYFTIGGVEGTEHHQIAKDANEVSISRTMSDVYVHPYCRRLGYGTLMIKGIIDEYYKDNTIYATIHNAGLYGFFEKIGFKELEDGILYYKSNEEE